MQNSPRTHGLKSWPEQFNLILAGSKTHEYRRNDRYFQVDDYLDLAEWDQTVGEYTGRNQFVLVTDISYGPAWGIPEGFCVMSIRKVE